MPALPIPATAKITKNSGHSDIDAMTTERTANGTLTGVSLWTTTKEVFELEIATCSRAERDAIRQSYRDNRAASGGTITFNYPRPSDPTVSARWVRPPTWTGYGKDRYIVRCPLEQV